MDGVAVKDSFYSQSMPVKTREAAQQLGVSYHRLINLIRFFKIDPPKKDASGDFVWDAEAIRRAQEALKRAPRARHRV
jgi:hypothetical protein